ncbi:MAG: carbon-nitrogen hydrolase family protein [Planctomycetes bacterium]|nr:carbon-nitrogen hydrolase family protein [Planctomycetota bacterium]
MNPSFARAARSAARTATQRAVQRDRSRSGPIGVRRVRSTRSQGHIRVLRWSATDRATNSTQETRSPIPISGLEIQLKIAIAQIAPVFLSRDATVSKVVGYIERAGGQGCGLVVFGETIVPAYPIWLCRTDAARFDADDQKRIHALYLEQAVSIESGHLDPVRDAAKRAGIAVVLGVAERPADRGGHTIYCSRVMIDRDGSILSVHRKLMPTYEERLSWGIGDGSGLVTHKIGEFTIGGLNCWENWMPLARAALYAAGENLHVALWPGAVRMTRDITRFIARESRSYVVSVGGLLREQDLPADMPLRERIAAPGETLLNGGSCIAGPDGEWIVEPVANQETMLTADLDIRRVWEERQNFDPAGHYARPDVLRLTVDRRRQTGAEFLDDTAGS